MGMTSMNITTSHFYYNATFPSFATLRDSKMLLHRLHAKLSRPLMNILFHILKIPIVGTFNNRP